MRVCRSVVLLAAIVAMAGCARQPRPSAQHAGMQAYAASPSYPGTSLDEMTYGQPGPRPQYGPPPGHRRASPPPQQQPSYAPAPAHRPPQGYRPVPVPAYASPPPSYRPAPTYRPAPSYYRPPPVAYRRVPPPSYPMQRPVRYVPMMKLPEDGPYTLDTGDKLRVVVFGQDTLSNTYLVDAAGQITMPLIGAVNARDATTQGLAAAVRNKLASGFIREPSVAVEVEIYRPFFVLGEVTYPGQYPFVPHMTVENAVAIAGGFTPRATKSSVTVTRRIQGMPRRFPMPLGYTMRPGDVITVGERWF
jgi:polysaccharide biosynthesis/export protein